jgi:hypothetical protein
MKKIAFYVEGQTEQFFVNKLLIEIAGRKNVQIVLQQFQGIGRMPKVIYPRTTAQPQNPQHYALIFDCMGDGGVKPRILEDAVSLFSQGYSEIIGLRDLYPLLLSDLYRFEQELTNGTIRNGRRITQSLPTNTSIVLAVREIEDWFLAECNHFTCIDVALNHSLITSLGFNPCLDDLTMRTNSAADDLKNIYELAPPNSYSKSKNTVQRTIECLNYTNLYLEIRYKIAKLNELITKIDNFLT